MSTIKRAIHFDFHTCPGIYDFNRGRNAADKVIYFLERNNPGKISFRNAAVAGDYITRVEDRLNGKGRDVKKYAGLFDKPCDLIFIALGSNDNRTLRSDGYAKPLVPFAEQTAAMIRVRSAAVERWSGASSPWGLAKWVFSMPSSSARLFIKSTKGMPASLASLSTLSQPSSTIGEKAITSTLYAINRLSAAI